MSSETTPPAELIPRDNVRLRREVVLFERDGRAWMAELDRGAFFALDPLGARLLSGALTHGASAAVRSVAQEYGVDEERVRGDWRRLARTLCGNRLLEPKQRRLPSLPGPAVLTILLTLAWITVRVFRWSSAVRLWHGKRPATIAITSLQGADHIVQQFDQAVRDAVARHWLNPQCKEAALVAWRLLARRFGLPSALVVGIVPFPFQAHAWVECGSWTVTDDRERCENYTLIARYT